VDGRERRRERRMMDVAWRGMLLLMLLLLPSPSPSPTPTPLTMG